ncbi:MAG: hypothetical protein ACRD92_08455, partial [Nitrosopumilaceae archaeon]
MSIFITPMPAAAISASFDSDSYGYDSLPAKITVLDPDADVTPTVDTVPVRITSNADPIGIALLLRETGDETGEFQNTAIVFMDGDNLFPEASTLTVFFNSGFIPETGIGTINVEVSSHIPLDFEERGIINPFILTQTVGPHYEAPLILTSIGPTTNTELEAAAGDIIAARFSCETSVGLITPNPDPTVGAIRAVVGDTVIVTYENSVGETYTDSATVQLIKEGGCGGGGSGGGLVISKVVLDVLAGGTST